MSTMLGNLTPFPSPSPELAFALTSGQWFSTGRQGRVGVVMGTYPTKAQQATSLSLHLPTVGTDSEDQRCC